MALPGLRVGPRRAADAAAGTVTPLLAPSPAVPLPQPARRGWHRHESRFESGSGNPQGDPYQWDRQGRDRSAPVPSESRTGMA